jgi:hypothetical protein
VDTAPDDLIHGYLDGRLTTGQLAELNDRLARDPELARRFALASLLHDRLRDRFREYGVDTEAGRPAGVEASPRRTRAVALRAALATGAAALLVVALVLAWAVGDRRVSAAEALLGRLIEAQGRAGDRTYRVVALAAGHPGPDDSQPRGRPRPTIDGALLHVRGDGQYVLVRRRGMPEEFITGSDGREAWSVPPDGPVRVSTDPARFRGTVPGEQQGLPFLDLKSALGRLRAAYELSLVDGSDGRLVAHKRSTVYRGPRDVTLWFDAASGVIRRLRMDGMPQAQGGPRSVALELIDRSDLGPAFYGHAAHHAPDRRVVRESP